MDWFLYGNGLRHESVNDCILEYLREREILFDY